MKTDDIYEQREAPYEGVAGLSTRELLSRITADAAALARKEIELAKAELRQNVSSTKTLAEGLGIGALLAFIGLNMLFVTAALALAEALPGWAAGLIVAGVLFAAAGIAAAIGWKKRVREPLAKTRSNVKEDVRWVKERLA